MLGRLLEPGLPEQVRQRLLDLHERLRVALYVVWLLERHVLVRDAARRRWGRLGLT
jgi:hypothetical protein